MNGLVSIEGENYTALRHHWNLRIILAQIFGIVALLLAELCCINVANADIQPFPAAFEGKSPPVANSQAHYLVLYDNQKFRWKSTDSVLGSVDTGFASTSKWNYIPGSGANPPRLIFIGSGGGATFYGDVLFGDYWRAVVDVVKGGKRIRYLLTEIIGGQIPTSNPCSPEGSPDVPALQAPCTVVTGGSYLSVSSGTMGDSYPVVNTPNSAGLGLGLALHYASYVADGQKAAIATVAGFGWSHSYNIFLFAQGQDLFKMSPTGLTTRYARDPANGQLTATMGTQQTIVENTNGSVDITNIPAGLTYHFDKVAGNPLLVKGSAPLMLTWITDRNGNYTNLYYQAGLLKVVEDAYKRQIQFAYDGVHRLKTITDPLGRVTELT